MQKIESLPHLADPEPKEITLEIASTEDWQKGDKAVRAGALQIMKQLMIALDTKQGALIGRNGTIELSVVVQMLFNQPFDADKSVILERNAGIFPKNEESVRKWYTEYLAAVVNTDCMAAGWYKPLARSEWRLLAEKNPRCKKIPLRSLEPYYCKAVDHWTRALDGKRVTVVSSFAATMNLQLTYKEQIWPTAHETLLPDATWSFVRSYYAPTLALGRAGWPKGITSWEKAVEHLETEVLKTNPEVVLIGCGGLGMILGHRLKQKGIVAIVMGGAIQVLFGIKGKRWENHPVISSFWNSDWIKPNEEEMPKGAVLVEGGCYW